MHYSYQLKILTWQNHTAGMSCACFFTCRLKVTYILNHVFLTLDKCENLNKHLYGSRICACCFVWLSILLSGMSYIKFPDLHTFLFYLFCKRYANFKGTKSVLCFYTKVLDLRLSSFLFVFRNSSMCGDIYKLANFSKLFIETLGR